MTTIERAAAIAACLMMLSFAAVCGVAAWRMAQDPTWGTPNPCAVEVRR